jgi:hypothetical protein
MEAALNTRSTIRRDGSVLVWAREVRERMALDAMQPDTGIEMQVSDCPSLAVYKRIMRNGQ